jgi:hypothetical protein
VTRVVSDISAAWWTGLPVDRGVQSARERYAGDVFNQLKIGWCEPNKTAEQISEAGCRMATTDSVAHRASESERYPNVVDVMA